MGSALTMQNASGGIDQAPVMFWFSELLMQKSLFLFALLLLGREEFYAAFARQGYLLHI